MTACKSFGGWILVGGTSDTLDASGIFGTGAATEASGISDVLDTSGIGIGACTEGLEGTFTVGTAIAGVRAAFIGAFCRGALFTTLITSAFSWFSSVTGEMFMSGVMSKTRSFVVPESDSGTFAAGSAGDAFLSASTSFGS
ncbi:MAG: hypothetical protein WC779_08355 [Candidatus Omnitrophota bacterium]